jgi:hypothetical protein
MYRHMLSASNDQSLANNAMLDHHDIQHSIQMPPKRLSARSLALRLNSSSHDVANTDNATGADSDHTNTIGLCWQDNTAAQKQV